MVVKTSRRKAAVCAAAALALCVCAGVSSVAFADGGSGSASDANCVPSSLTSTKGYVTGAATRAAGPSLEILGVASVEESGQFVDTSSWYSWSQPKYYLAASDYNSELSPYLANLAYTSLNGAEEEGGYEAAVLNTSRSGGGSGPNASLATDGSDETDAEVWALDPDVVVGTGGAEYSDDVNGVSYSFSNYTSLVETMNAIAAAADAADANDAAATLRYGSAEAIADDYEEYVFGTIGAVAEAINDGTVEKKTVALVESYEDGKYYCLTDAGSNAGDGTAASNRYLETTSANGLGDALDLADNLVGEDEEGATIAVTASELAKADLILVGGQQSSADTDDIVDTLDKAGLLSKTYAVEGNGSNGAMYGVVMNSVENAQNVGRILGCLYPTVVDQQSWLAYYYENFYHIGSDELAAVMENALEGVRCWDGDDEDVFSWSVSGGYSEDVSSGSVTKTLATGLAYYNSNADSGSALSALSLDAEDDTVEEGVFSVTNSSGNSVYYEETTTNEDGSTNTTTRGFETIEEVFTEDSTADSGYKYLTDGCTVTLNEDYEADTSMTFDSSNNLTDLTIDLGGHVLDYSGSTLFNANYGPDSMKFVSSSGQGEMTSDGYVVYGSGNNACDVSVENVDMTSNSSLSNVGNPTIYWYCASALIDLDNVNASKIVGLDDDETLNKSCICVSVPKGTMTAEDCSFNTYVGGGSHSPSTSTSTPYYTCALSAYPNAKTSEVTLSLTNCELEVSAEYSSSTNLACGAYYRTKSGGTLDVNLNGCDVDTYSTGTGSPCVSGIYSYSTTYYSSDTSDLLLTVENSSISAVGEGESSSGYGIYEGGTSTLSDTVTLGGANTISGSTASIYQYASVIFESGSTLDGVFTVENDSTYTDSTIATLASADDGAALARAIEPASSSTYAGYIATVSDSSLVWSQDNDLADATVTLDTESYTYDGTAKTPTVTVTLNGTALTAGTDYTAYYYDNVNAGTARVVIVGAGSYSGRASATYTIDPVSVTVPSVAEGLTYTGEAQTAVSVATGYESVYTITGNTETGAGSYTAVLKLTDWDNYRWAVAETSGDTTTYTYLAGAQFLDWTIEKAEQPISFTSDSIEKHADTSSFVNEIIGDVQEDATITYTSSDNDIVMVNASGRVSIVGDGTAQIAASFTETTNYKAYDYAYTVIVSSHSYGEGVVTEPTCTEGGCTTYTCSICGDSYTENETDATGHSYEGVLSDDGKSITYTCTSCGDSYAADVSASYEAGYDDGYDQGETDASDTTDENSAYSQGYSAGYTQATTDASDSTDSTSAYSAGYEAGYAAGMAAVSSSSSSSSASSSSSSSTAKKAQSMKVTKKNKTVKAKQLKKKAQKVKAITVKNYKGKLSFKKVSGSKKLSLVKGGKIKVKKGTKKGTYKIKVKVTAAGNSSYKSASKTVTVTIKVK